MHIPVNVDVHCMDGLCGRSTYVITNPVTQEVTHVVVRQQQAPQTERVVPIGLVKVTTPDMILLECDKAKLSRLRAFVETHYLQVTLPETSYAEDEYLSLPFTVPQGRRVLIKQKQRAIPPGELAVHRGTRVEAADGRVGRVDEFVVDPESGHITHMILREGHLWGDDEVTIPVSEIAKIEENVVHLKLTREQVEALPTVKVERAWP